MNFQRIFLLVIWFIWAVLYFFLSYKSSKGLRRDVQAKKILIAFEWIYRHLLIVVMGYILLFDPMSMSNSYGDIGWVIIILGMVLIGGGCVFLFWARFFLKENWTVGWSFLKEGHQLITGGPYKIVRHPIYLAFLFMVSGTALVMLNKYFLIFAIAVGVTAYLKAKSEEKALLEKFGIEYENYKKTVPMLFPLTRRVKSKKDEILNPKPF